MPQIKVRISPDGNSTIETTGFTGTDCLRETMELERALGAKTRDTMTAEAGRSSASANIQRAGN